MYSTSKWIFLYVWRFINVLLLIIIITALSSENRLHNDETFQSQTVRRTNMNWVDYYQYKLKSAYAKATEQLELDMSNRKTRYDKHTKEDTLQIEDHIHLRSRVKGCNTIGVRQFT